MKPKPKQIIIIDSQSDIDSSLSNRSMQIEQEYNNMSIRSQTQQDMYQKFNSSTFFLVTDSLLKYANQINQFLQSRKKNVLFIFGPSGCGKSNLVRRVLQHSKIKYYTLEEQENEDGRIVSLGDVILTSLTKMNSVWPYVCYDFPITLQKWSVADVRQFKARYSQQIKKTITKMIFVLNQEIYNSFYVLNERANSQDNLNHRQNVTIIKIEKFGVNQMKKLIKGFYEHEKLYNYVGLGKDFLDQVIQLANGDARKALNLLYMRGVEDKAQNIRKQELKKVEKYYSDKKRKSTLLNEKTSFKSLQKRVYADEDDSYWNSHQISSNLLNHSSNMSSMKMYTNTVAKKQNPKKVRQPPPNYSRFMKYKRQDESRCTLYHGLGKLLYGKRLNVRNIPKNKKDVSCYYNEMQMNELDPPFYFDPVLLFEQLRVDFDIVARLLQENYIERYGKIKDVKKMADIFCMDDGFFSYLDIVQNEDVRELKAILITWGILIYNKNSRTDNMGFRKISKSQSSHVHRKVKQKKRLLKVYFPESDLNDLLKFAHLTRHKVSTSLLNQTIFNQSISQSFQTRVDDHTKTLKDEDQQQMETIMKLNTNDIENKLRENHRMMEKKKKDMEAVFAEMYDEDDEIDEIENSD